MHRNVRRKQWDRIIQYDPMDFSTLPGLLGMLTPLMPKAAPVYVFGTIVVVYFAYKVYTNLIFVAAVLVAAVVAYIYYFGKDSASTAKILEAVKQYQTAFYADNTDFITNTTARLQNIRHDLRR